MAGYECRNMVGDGQDEEQTQYAAPVSSEPDWPDEEPTRMVEALNDAPGASRAESLVSPTEIPRFALPPPAPDLADILFNDEDMDDYTEVDAPATPFPALHSPLLPLGDMPRALEPQAGLGTAIGQEERQHSAGSDFGQESPSWESSRNAGSDWLAAENVLPPDLAQDEHVTSKLAALATEFRTALANIKRPGTPALLIVLLASMVVLALLVASDSSTPSAEPTPPAAEQ